MQIEAPHFYLRVRLPRTPDGGFLPYPEKKRGKYLPIPTVIPAKVRFNSLFSGSWEVCTEGITGNDLAADEVEIWVWIKEEQKSELDRIEVGMNVEVEVETGIFTGVVSRPPVSDTLLSEVLAKRSDLIQAPHFHVRARPTRKIEGETLSFTKQEERVHGNDFRRPAKLLTRVSDLLEIFVEIAQNRKFSADEVEIRVWLGDEEIKAPPRIRAGMEVAICVENENFEGFVFHPKKPSEESPG